MLRFLPPDDRPISLTSAAVDALRRELEETGHGSFVRINMNPDEILSPRYTIDFDDEPKPDDVSMDFEGVKVVIATDSVRRLCGTLIDSIETLDGPSFRFLK